MSNSCKFQSNIIITHDPKKLHSAYIRIYTIEDLIRNNKISKNDKQRCLKCFGYVRKRYELTGVEPFNGHNIIQLEKYAIDIRILPDGIIKYCRSLGEKNVEKDFTKIQMGI